MIALLSNVTAEPLALELAGTAGEKIWTAPGYNTWAQELLLCGFGGEKPGAVFLILDGSALLGEAASADFAAAREILDGSLEQIENFARNHGEIPFAVSSLDIPQKKITPLASPRPEHRAESYWRMRLEELGIPVLELAAAARELGYGNFYSPRAWYLAGSPFSAAGGRALCRRLESAWNAVNGRRRKCLILDLDNTLWGGVIGEDGVGGIELSAEKEGARYRDFQKRLKELKETGVLLAVVSKNNMEDALEGINGHPGMVLREGDFVSIKANWRPKPENIEELARELNLGADAFVFLDDSPIEREAVKIALPEVAVPDFPADTASLPRFAEELAEKYFPALRLTGEDLQKTQQYRRENERGELRRSAATLREYLASLKMELTFRAAAEEDVPRAAQLTQKTNQFNLTARRCTEGEIRERMESGDYRIWIGGLSDRFGDYGKIILSIVRLEGPRAEIELFLMSCRAMGRGVEEEFLEKIEAELKAAGIKQITALYIETSKNALVKNFWEERGYAPEGEEKGRRRYRKELV